MIMNATASWAITPIDGVIGRLLAIYSGWTRDTTVEQMRRDWDAAFRYGGGIGTCDPVSADGVEAAWIGGPGLSTEKALLYLHGGGYRIGSIASHRDLITRTASASGYRALAINYRLAPEHRFPAALEDAVTAFRWLRSQGYAADDIAIVGDSAGGGLAVSCMLELRQRDGNVPRAGVLLSPWTDLAAAGDSYVSRAESDPIHQRPMIVALAKNYLGEGGNARDPRASPIYADLGGLPPLLIQVGDRETVLDDSRLFAEKAKSAGVDVQLEVWSKMIHVFQMFASDLKEAEQAVAGIGQFLRRHLAADAGRVLP